MNFASKSSASLYVNVNQYDTQTHLLEKILIKIIQILAKSVSKNFIKIKIIYNLFLSPFIFVVLTTSIYNQNIVKCIGRYKNLLHR